MSCQDGRVAIIALAEVEGGVVAHQNPEPLEDRLVEAVLRLELVDEFRIEPLRAAIAGGDVADRLRPADADLPASAAEAGGRALIRALKLRDGALDRAAGHELHDGEGDSHDAEDGRDHQQQAADDVGEHGSGAERESPHPVWGRARSCRWGELERSWPRHCRITALLPPCGGGKGGGSRHAFPAGRHPRPPRFEVSPRPQKFARPPSPTLPHKAGGSKRDGFHPRSSTARSPSPSPRPTTTFRARRHRASAGARAARTRPSRRPRRCRDTTSGPNNARLSARGRAPCSRY